MSENEKQPAEETKETAAPAGETPAETGTNKEAAAAAEATAEAPTTDAPAAEAAPVEDPEQIAAQEEMARQQAAAEAEAARHAEEVKTKESLRAGMTVRVHIRIKEGEKERIQIFQGMIVALRGKTPATKTMTVEKESFGVRVQRIFPLASPIIAKIEVVKQAKVRRSKLFFLEKYGRRLKETFVK